MIRILQVDKFQLEYIPLLEKEGWLRHPSESREATVEPQTGWSLTQHVSEAHSETTLLSDHRVRASSERIHFVNGASTPPYKGGECARNELCLLAKIIWDIVFYEHHR